jgi:ubiquinone biosynthesis protein UbiJ
MTSRTNAVVSAHQTGSLKSVAEAQHCTESLKMLIEEFEEIERGWEEVRRIREVVKGLRERVDKLEKWVE